MPLVFTHTPPVGNALAAMLAAKKAGELEAAKQLLIAVLPDVPFDSGRLYGDAYFDPDKGEGASVVFTAVNPKDQFDYAEVQHQRTDFDHPHGKDHWLSDGMEQRHDVIAPPLFGPVHALLA